MSSEHNTLEAKLGGFTAQGEYTGRLDDSVRGLLEADRIASYLAELQRLGARLWERNELPVIALELSAGEHRLRIFATDSPELDWSSKTPVLSRARSATEAAETLCAQFAEPCVRDEGYRAAEWERPLPAIRHPAPTEEEEQGHEAAADAQEYFDATVLSDPVQRYAAAKPEVIAGARPKLHLSLVMGAAGVLVASPVFIVGDALKEAWDKPIAATFLAVLMIGGVAFCLGVARRYAKRYAIVVDRAAGLLFAVVGKEARVAVRLDQVEQIALQETELRKRIMPSKYRSEIVDVDGTAVLIVLREHAALCVFQFEGAHTKLATRSNTALGLRATKDWRKGREVLMISNWSYMWADDEPS